MVSQAKLNIALKWIRAESGETYVCPADVIDRLDHPTEEDLRRHCVVESQNPQND